MKHAPTRPPQRAMALPAALRTPEQVVSPAQAPAQAGPGFHSRLPPLARQPEADGSLPALEMLVSASCYLSMSPEGTAEARLEAAKLCHDLAAALGPQVRVPGTLPETSREDLEETIWLKKQSKWERHYCVETAIRFVLSPPETPVPGSRRTLGRWTSWWARLRQPPRVQPF